MEIAERIEIVTHLQITSQEVFSAVIQSLRLGMSELAISEMIRLEFQKRGIEEYWYNVPRNVLIGTERFKIGTTTTDYAVKNPAADVILEPDSPLFIDLSPVDPKTKIWGDWANTIIFKPKQGEGDEQVAFLREFREIHRQGIAQITAKTTGAEVANYFLKVFKQKGISLLDVRNNVGHSIHEGSKDKAKRVWLDGENNLPLGEGIFTVEPGGCRERQDGKGIVIARFEVCIYIPQNGVAKILGDTKELPLLM